jgi:hypothetical protein
MTKSELNYRVNEYDELCLLCKNININPNEGEEKCYCNLQFDTPSKNSEIDVFGSCNEYVIWSKE